jgi:hypothetical protein
VIKTKNLRIKPKWLLSQSYNLFDDHGRKICEIIYPLTYSLMNRNVAYLIIDNEKHQIVDAIHHATLIGENKPVNTYIEIDGKKIIEIEYTYLGSNEKFHVSYEEMRFHAELKGYGIHEISHNKKIIGVLKNKEIFLRRSTMKFDIEIPVLVQAMIFWASINKQEII